MSKQGFASIGTKVTVDSTELNYVTNIGDIGGAPASLETTCMNDRMKHSENGVQDVGNFEIDFQYDNSATDSDFRVLRGLADGQEHTIKITLPDGTEATSAGVMSVWSGGFGVNAIIPAKLSVALSQDWVYKNPTT